jgi:hypothetical protein
VGLIDRIRETAQSGIDKGQARVSERQAKQATNELLRNLGLVTHRQRTGAADPDRLEDLAAALSDRLTATVQAYGPLPEPRLPTASPGAPSSMGAGACER